MHGCRPSIRQFNIGKKAFVTAEKAGWDQRVDEIHGGPICGNQEGVPRNGFFQTAEVLFEYY